MTADVVYRRNITGMLTKHGPEGFLEQEAVKAMNDWCILNGVRIEDYTIEVTFRMRHNFDIDLDRRTP